MDGQKQAKKHRPNLTNAKLPPMPEGVTLPSSHRAPRKVSIRPKFRDLGSDEAVWALYHRWCLHYNICRTSEEMGKRFGIFKKNAIHVFQMNQMDPSCLFHLSSFCDEKDLFDPSGDEEMTLTPTEKDLESDEAVWDLYYRWCLYHKILRTPEEMQQRFSNFKMSAFYAVKMNQKDPSCHFCLSIWCDKIDLRYSSGVEEMTLTPTKGDLESDEALMDLYRRWCLHHNIRRTPEEMQLAFSSFKKSATHVFEMSQKDPTVQFGLSIWCDETDNRHHQVRVIPTERDLKSGNALLGLYHRYCRAYEKYRTPEEMKQRFSNFKKSVNHVFEMNKTDPSWQYYLSSCCDEKDMLDRAARKVSIRPKFWDLGSDEAVWALYHRWCLHYNIRRTSEEMATRFDIFMKNAIHVFEMNELDPDPFCQFHLSSCDEKDLFGTDTGRVERRGTSCPVKLLVRKLPTNPSGDEEMTLTPTEKDLESDEAVWDLYYRWCLYHKILRTPEEMQQRFKNFKMSAFYAVKMNQKDPSCHFCLSIWCDKIDLRC